MLLRELIPYSFDYSMTFQITRPHREQASVQYVLPIPMQSLRCVGYHEVDPK